MYIQNQHQPKTNIGLKPTLCTTCIHLEAPNVCMWYIVLVLGQCWFWVYLPYCILERERSATIEQGIDHFTNRCPCLWAYHIQSIFQMSLVIRIWIHHLEVILKSVFKYGLVVWKHDRISNPTKCVMTSPLHL